MDKRVNGKRRRVGPHRRTKPSAKDVGRRPAWDGPKDEGKRPVHVTYVLDESGSMDCVKGATIEGFNSYVDQLRETREAEDVRLTLVAFNGDAGIRTFERCAPLSGVRGLSAWNYNPNGGTPLYDAVMHGISNAKAMRGVDHIVVVHTDGMENMSRVHNAWGVSAEISRLREAGWTFVFLGADQNAWEQAGSIGIPACNTISYSNNAMSTRRTFKGLADVTVNYVTSNSAYRGSSACTSGIASATLGGGDTGVDWRDDK